MYSQATDYLITKRTFPLAMWSKVSLKSKLFPH